MYCKQFLLNKIIYELPYDMKHEIFGYLFYDKETSMVRKNAKMNKGKVFESIIKASLNKQFESMLPGFWIFNSENLKMGAVHCCHCGNYLETMYHANMYGIYPDAIICSCDQSNDPNLYYEEYEEDYDY